MRALGLAALVVALVAAAGCGRVGVPRVGLPGAGAGNEGTERLVENRVWVERGGDGFRAYLSDGTFVSGACGAPARFGAWRWVDEGVLAADEPDGTLRSEVAMVGPGEMVLVRDGESRSFVAGRSPVCRR